jgi:hypothetical protein
MASTVTCPECGSSEFHRSHVRNTLERLRKNTFKQSPYRCHSCNHRVWLNVKIITPKRGSKRAVLYLMILIISTVVGIIVGSTIN